MLLTRESCRHLAAITPLAGLLLALGASTLVQPGGNVSMLEKRALAPLPEAPRSAASLFAWPRGFDAWFSDHIGLRSTMVSVFLTFRVRIMAFGVVDLAGVLTGRDGWLYYTGHGEIDNMDRTHPILSDQVERWCRLNQERQRWLAARGIPYLVVLAPNKETVYPEHLPRGFAIPDRPRRADRLVSDLRSQPGVDVLDLGPVLVRARGELPLFLRYDSHWTELGAYYGYVEIVERLRRYFPALRPRRLDAFTIKPVRRTYGDLAAMLGLNGVLDDVQVVLEPRLRREAEVVVSDEYQSLRGWRRGTAPVITQRRDAEIGRALFLRDSSSVALVPFLAEHFGRAVFLWWDVGFPAEVVDKEHPDVVVFEITERMLGLDPPANPPSVVAAADARETSSSVHSPPGAP